MNIRGSTQADVIHYRVPTSQPDAARRTYEENHLGRKVKEKLKAAKPKTSREYSALDAIA